MTISVIIPVYNKHDSLSRCIDSVINQKIDTSDYEIILVNDGSNDKSWEIICGYTNKYSNVHVVNQENSGVSVARNRGIELANGDYVLFLDADDELVHDSLDKVITFLNNNTSTDMLITRQIKKTNNDERIMPVMGLKEDIKYNGIDAFKCGYVRTNAGGGICRRKFLNEHQLIFPVGIRNAEDTIFFTLAQMFSECLLYLNIPFYIINAAEGSASRVNETQLAINHVETVYAMAKIRNSIFTSQKQKGLIEFVMYQLISNTIGHFIASDRLVYKDLKKRVAFSSILPLDTTYMSLMRNKAKILNLSVSFFYFLNWVKAKF